MIVKDIGCSAVGDGAVDDVVQENRFDRLGGKCLELGQDLVDGRVGGSEKCLVGRTCQVGELNGGRRSDCNNHYRDGHITYQDLSVLRGQTSEDVQIGLLENINERSNHGGRVSL